MSEACHTAPHHRMIKTPFGKLSHCLREGPLFEERGWGWLVAAGGGRGVKRELESRVNPALSLSSLLSHSLQASPVMKAISKDLHLAKMPRSAVITDTGRFLSPLAFAVGYE